MATVLESSSLEDKRSHAQLCLTPRDPRDWSPPGFSVLAWNFLGKNTGVGCHFLLQGIFLIQGSESCFLHRQKGSLPLSCLGSPEKTRIADNYWALTVSWVLVWATSFVYFGSLFLLNECPERMPKDILLHEANLQDSTQRVLALQPYCPPLFPFAFRRTSSTLFPDLWWPLRPTCSIRGQHNNKTPYYLPIV